MTHLSVSYVETKNKDMPIPERTFLRFANGETLEAVTAYAQQLSSNPDAVNGTVLIHDHSNGSMFPPPAE